MSSSSQLAYSMAVYNLNNWMKRQPQEVEAFLFSLCQGEDAVLKAEPLDWSWTVYAGERPHNRARAFVKFRNGFKEHCLELARGLRNGTELARVPGLAFRSAFAPALKKFLAARGWQVSKVGSTWTAVKDCKACPHLLRCTMEGRAA